MFQNNDELIQYIKYQLGAPYNIEVDDNFYPLQIKKQLSIYSSYNPLQRTRLLTFTSNQDEYIISDKDGLPIINIQYVTPRDTNLQEQNNLWLLYSEFPLSTGMNLVSFIQQNQTYHLITQIIGREYTITFEPPNKIIVSPTPDDNVLVQVLYYQGYTDISQLTEFDKDWIYRYVMQEVKENLGRIRTLFNSGSINTPLGTIETNGSQLLDEQKTEKEQLMQELQNRSMISNYKLRG